MKAKPSAYEIKNRGWKWIVYAIYGKNQYRRRLGIFTSQRQAENWLREYT
jgi:hypothetical protein